MSLCRLVCLSVGLSVRRSKITSVFLAFLQFLRLIESFLDNLKHFKTVFESCFEPEVLLRGICKRGN